jgi:hypothetical protein
MPAEPKIIINGVHAFVYHVAEIDVGHTKTSLHNCKITTIHGSNSPSQPSAHLNLVVLIICIPLLFNNYGGKCRCCPATPTPKDGVLLLHYILHIEEWQLSVFQRVEFSMPLPRHPSTVSQIPYLYPALKALPSVNYSGCPCRTNLGCSILSIYHCFCTPLYFR